ncbi:E3 ubiquitin-protein ligase RNF182-like [Periophthalmus magnuspinnatus]|uniref:E3 ubiquitin-protein ligase RNF182-like n=1 Tax=Periophthalmus magnuspinnatus TaxID=409849 RepID=UPI002436B6AD|nr:E3 ubiquitin-protein ligase RNF182-like [Periophthalmus magnuspinnatus]
MREAEEADGQVAVLSAEPLELDCKICYSRYDATGRRPKVLQCQHRVCATCMHRLLLQAGDVLLVVTCPFCRQETQIRHNELWLMEEDTHILSVLIRDQFQRKTRIPTRLSARIPTQTESGSETRTESGSETRTESGSGEVLLSPTSLSDSDCLLITVLEVPDESSSSLSVLSAIYRPPGSAHSYLPKSHTWTSRSVPRCLLGALCMVYFSSLPLGIYLLMTARLWLGVALVSLVPLTLLALVVYGFCQCLIQEAVDAAHRLQTGHQNTASP